MPIPTDKNHFFFIACLALAVILMSVWAMFQGGCSEATERGQVDTEPCELVCYSIDACFGFEATELTFEACLDTCEQSTAMENKCFQSCDQIMDCDLWFDCILACP